MDAKKWANRPRLSGGIASRSHLLVHRPSTLAKRLAALLVTAALLTIVAPVLASESNSVDAGEPTTSQEVTSLTPDESSTATESTTAPASASPSPNPSDENSAAPMNSSDTQTASASPSPKPPAATADQAIRINVPSVLPVDPRALTRILPAINLSGPEYLLACINSPNLIFDLGQKNVLDSVSKDDGLLSGDYSQNTLISGTAAQVQALINSSNGLRMVSLRGAISSAVATFSFVAVSKPVINPALCNQSTNIHTLSFRPLGLGMDLVKNKVILKK